MKEKRLSCLVLLKHEHITTYFTPVRCFKCVLSIFSLCSLSSFCLSGTSHLQQHATGLSSWHPGQGFSISPSHKWLDSSPSLSAHLVPGPGVSGGNIISHTAEHDCVLKDCLAKCDHLMNLALGSVTFLPSIVSLYVSFVLVILNVLTTST